MAEVQEQFEQATQQPQPQKANWWYTLPEKDGLMVDLMTEDMNSYVAIEVYEDGNLEPFSKRMNLSEQRALSFRPLATKGLIAEC